MERTLDILRLEMTIVEGVADKYSKQKKTANDIIRYINSKTDRLLGMASFANSIEIINDSEHSKIIDFIFTWKQDLIEATIY